MQPEQSSRVMADGVDAFIYRHLAHLSQRRDAARDIGGVMVALSMIGTLICERGGHIGGI